MNAMIRKRLWRNMLWLISFAFAVYGCESQDLPEAPPEPVVEEIVVPQPETVPSVVESPKSALLVRIPTRSRERLPKRALGVVRLTATGAQESYAREQQREQQIDAFTNQVLFENLELGRYQLAITYLSNDREVGSYTYPVDVGKEVRDVTAPINFLRGKVIINSSLNLTFNQGYQGMARVVPQGCIDRDEMELLRSEAQINILDDQIEITLTMIPGEEFALSGTSQASREARQSAGRYSSSDGSSGSWILTEIAAPSSASLWLSLEMHNERDDCQAQAVFAGLVDGPGGAVVGEVPQTQITVELVGQGQNHSVELLAGQSEAVFDELLIGSYDVFVDLSNNGQLVDAYRDSVTLADEEVRLTAEFDLPQPLMGVVPLTLAESYDSLAGRYQGKSLVSQGQPECMGSISLVDSTLLDLWATGAEFGLEFDNFYGRVLNLTGQASTAADSMLAAGGYESSDSKTGVWAIRHLSASEAGQIAIQVDFENETDNCKAVYEFLGLRE